MINRNLPDTLAETTTFEYQDVPYEVPVFFDTSRLTEYAAALPTNSETERELTLRIVTSASYNVWLAAKDFSSLPRFHEYKSFSPRFAFARRILLRQEVAVSNGEPTRAARIAITTSGLVTVNLIPNDVAQEIEAFTGLVEAKDAPKKSNSQKVRLSVENVPASINRSNWSQAAACRDVGEDIFFSDIDDNIAAAKAVCDECAVREYCLEEALSKRIKEGVWGGLDEQERRQILAREQKQKN